MRRPQCPNAGNGRLEMVACNFRVEVIIIPWLDKSVILPPYFILHNWRAQPIENHGGGGPPGSPPSFLRRTSDSTSTGMMTRSLTLWIYQLEAKNSPPVHQWWTVHSISNLEIFLNLLEESPRKRPMRIYHPVNTPLAPYPSNQSHVIYIYVWLCHCLYRNLCTYYYIYEEYNCMYM